MSERVRSLEILSLDSRLITSSPDLFIDTAPSSVDRAVLSNHDGLKSGLGLDIPRKSRQLGDGDDDLGDRYVRPRYHLDGWIRKSQIDTLNFFPSLAARTIRLTSAWPIKFSTACPSLVLVILIEENYQ